MPGQPRLTGIERRSVRDELANALERAFLQRHDDDRLAGGAETKVGEPLDELLHDRRAQSGVGDEIRPVGALDDERGAPVEAIRGGVADPQPSQLLVAEPALDRGLARAPTTAVQEQRAGAERQTADEGLPVRLSPLDRVRRHSDSTVGLYPTAGNPWRPHTSLRVIRRPGLRACRAPRPGPGRCARR